MVVVVTYLLTRSWREVGGWVYRCRAGRAVHAIHGGIIKICRLFAEIAAGGRSVGRRPHRPGAALRSILGVVVP